MLSPGEMAPAFKVMSHEGKDVSLSQFTGSKVVLWFYPKADTPG
jgi:thioredoxin-dependent peroxiredoxin